MALTFQSSNLCQALAQATGAFQETEKAKPEKAKTATPTKRPTVDDLAWIAGHWQGEAMGGSFEETWNPPFGGTMMGMFKFVKNDEVAFYEILNILEENGKLLVRLKHFDKGLVGWEEKDKSIEFPFISMTKNEAIFDGLKFFRVDDDTLKIVVTMKNGDKSTDLDFVCKRKPLQIAKSSDK